MPSYNQKEINESKRIGARPHKNSGRGMVEKGDGSNSLCVIDYKFANRSFTINQDKWAKICSDTIKTDPDKYPMLLLILGEDGRPQTRLAVIEYALFQELLDEHDRIDQEKQ